jgi:hypothetical protein
LILLGDIADKLGAPLVPPIRKGGTPISADFQLVMEERGFSPHSIYRWLAGHRAPTSANIYKLRQLARTLGVNTQDIE